MAAGRPHSQAAGETVAEPLPPLRSAGNALHGVRGRGLGKACLHRPPQLQKPEAGHGPHGAGRPGGEPHPGLPCDGGLEAALLLGARQRCDDFSGAFPAILSVSGCEPRRVQPHPGAAAGRQPRPAGCAARAHLLRHDEV